MNIPLMRYVRSSSGMTLLGVVLLLMLVGTLVTAGIKMIGPLVQRGKVNDTKTTISSNVDAILSWAVSNCRIPDAGGGATDFTKVASNPKDAWGNNLAYLYAPELNSASSCAQFCGVNATAMKFDLGGAITDNLAFIILSSEYSSFHNKLPSGALVTGSASVSGTVTQVFTDPPDIYRVVTLDELKAKIGCYGPTGGVLRIVNNELPSVCSGGATSPATLFADGGAGGYTWTLVAPPTWLILNSSTGALLPNPAITGTAGTYPVTVRLTDSHPNTVQRTYNLTVKSCPTNTVTFLPSADPTVVANNWNGGASNDQGTNNTTASSGKFDLTLSPATGTLDVISIQNGTSGNCIWYQAPLTLTGKKMRAYFSFVFTSGEGFAFAMVPSLGQTTISSCDENSALGFGSDIPGSTLLGLEFYDPNLSTCITTDGSQCTGNNNSWSEGIPYYVRAELDTTVTPNPVYKVWLTANPAHKNAFEDLSTAYSGTLTPLTTKTLSSQNVSDLSSFFLGFTASQHGNDKVNMVLSGLKFVLY